MQELAKALVAAQKEMPAEVVYAMRAAGRFVQKVELTEDGCWTWRGGMIGKGYGGFHFAGRSWSAHRWSYEFFAGPIPDGLTVDHLCRNRACVNPAHLEPVSNRENILRGDGLAALNARKTHCVNGHPLTPENLTGAKGRRQCRICRQAVIARAKEAK